MPLIATRGAASVQGFGEFAQAAAPVYIEDVFNTYLTTGAGSAITVTNDIDLSGKGGLVWTKPRNTTGYHVLFDTERGADKGIYTNTTDAQATNSNWLSFNNNGFTIGTTNNLATSSTTGVSFTFRKAKKFFDVVTYTGNGSNRTISHNLGSVPGCMIIKRTDTTGNWATYHRSLGNETRLYLNTTDASVSGTSIWQSTTPTSTEFYVDNNSNVNANGGTYVAYLFAHDAGGFGLTGSDNVISCGSFTSTYLQYPNINLGYEPQWVLVKRTDIASDWWIMDNMRPDFTADAAAGNVNTKVLKPNSSAAEGGSDPYFGPNATGFGGVINFSSGTTGTYIYIAIRRGPMKTPTSGTSVFSPVASSASTGTTLTTNFPIDMQLSAFLSGYSNNTAALDRLRGVSSTTTETVVRLTTSSTGAESASGIASRNWSNTGFEMPSALGGGSSIFWNFRRAPGFFDVVCYTGAGGVQTVNHNLGVVPEMMIVKHRNGPDDWPVYHSALGNTKYLWINSTNAEATSQFYWNNTTPTSSVFTLGGQGRTNDNGGTYVAYLFATVVGVSKVGSYTGTGTTLQVNCGFTNGSRFVLIKRTDSTGDWYVWDSARGIVAGNDPYLLLNSTAAEVTSTDYVDTYSAGFEISSTAPAAINANGGTFIFLAVA